MCIVSHRTNNNHSSTHTVRNHPRNPSLIRFAFFLYFSPFQEIYREIESNSRAVAACVRAYEKKAAKASRFSGNISGVTSVGSSILNTTASELGGPPSGSGSLTPEVDAQPGTSVAYYSHKLSNKSKESSVIKGLERRYYLLYLKAYEIRCLLEGLLDTKTSVSLSTVVL